MTARQFRLDAAIRMFGFWVKWVPANGATPGFAYTVGLSEKGRRDLLITGLPLKTSIDLLSDLAYLEQDRDVYEAAFIGRTLRAVEITDPYAIDPIMPTLAIQRARSVGADLRLAQVVWPDRRGLFPWEPGALVAPDQHLRVGPTTHS